MIQALIILSLLAAPKPGRFSRFEKRQIEGRSARGFLASESGSSSFIPAFWFAPPSGAGLGGDCACESVTDSTGSIAMTFTRSTTALCVSGQTFAECPIDRPRIQNGAFFMEPAATNLFTRSDVFSGGIWSKSGVTVTEDYGLSPLGEMTADRLEVNACPSGGTFNVVYQAISPASATAVSAWVKGVSGSGTITIYSYGANGTATNCDYVETEWRRCTHLRGIAQSEAGFGCVNHASVTGSGNTGAADVLIWRAVATDTTYIDSGIETGPATVTRSADSQLSATIPTTTAGNFCLAVTTQKTASEFASTPQKRIVRIPGSATVTYVSDTQLSLAISSTSTPAVSSVGTSAHRLIWSYLGSTETATWDGAALSPSTGTGMIAASSIFVGNTNGLVSNVQLDVAGCQ